MEWLNEYSRKFLDNGYLINGQSAEERIRFMADSAERIIGKKVLLTRFMIMHQKDSIVFQVQFGQTSVLREVFQSHVLDHISEMIWQIFSIQVQR